MMDEEPDPIRDIVYQRLDKPSEKGIQEEFLQGNGREVIDELVSSCMDDILEVPGSPEENIAAMATVLMHYLCTTLLIPAQRKTVLDGTCIDIVIPDTRTLKTNWNSSVVLCILTSSERTHVEQRIADARRIQPNQENIWIISPGPVETEYRTFTIGSHENPFSSIIDRINEFLEKNRSARFRIFKAV